MPWATVSEAFRHRAVFFLTSRSETLSNSLCLSVMRNNLALTALAILLLCPVAWGQRGRDRDRGRDRSDRFTEALQRWDANDDGIVTKEEAPGRAWGFIQRRAEAAGLDAAEGVRIKALTGDNNEEQAESASNSQETAKRKTDSDAKPNPMAFGVADDKAGKASPAGFGIAPEEEADKPEPRRGRSRSRSDRSSSSGSGENDDLDKAKRYADGLIKRYDKNNSGALEKEEWTDIRGEPARADANKDGVITRSELTARMQYNLRKDKSGGTSRRETSRSAERKAGEGRQTYRFTPPQERLPEGLPGWFKSKDKNGDGQVAMHEYNRRWTDRSAGEFARYDKNGDGMVTPDEVAKPKR